MKKLIIITAVLLIKGMYSFGQQEPMISQYMFNGLFLNPAYAGTHKYWTSSMSARSQWVGFEGAPRTFIAAVDGPVPNKNIGLGLVMYNDRIGVSNQNTVIANYAYHLRVNKAGHILSLGASAGVSQFSARLTDLTVWDANDVVFQNNITSNLIPRFGFGAYYYTEDWYAGFSIPTLLGYQKGNDFTIDVSKATFLHRHYLLTGGYIFKLNDQVKLRPSMLVKYLPQAPVQVDLNLGVLFRDMLWVGTSFRTGDAVVMLIEYQSNSFFRIGYAYDITFSPLRKHSSGSHEILIGIDFGKDLIKTKTPRYF
jgi:type IX secretion system PorP/SprF family membrane protein